MADKQIFHLNDLCKSYGRADILRGITVSILEGARIGVIGHNGSGKSSLMRIIAGEDLQFEGVARPAAGLSIGYLPQEPPLNDDLDVMGNLREALQPLIAVESRYHEVAGLLGTASGAEADALNDEFSRLTQLMDIREIWELEHHLELAAEALGLPPMEARVSLLSGGERRRIALCRLLMQHPDLLLLDEPTNHLDTAAIEWLEHHLQTYRGTVMLVTHDRYFLDNVVGWMFEIERGRGQPYKGNYSDYLQAKQSELAVKRGQEANREKILARELEWIRKTPSARTSRSKARLTRYKELTDQKAEDILDTVDLRIPPGPRLGDKVVEVQNVTKAYGDRVLFRDLSFELPPGGVLGVIGPNGAGKTTLMKMIIGQEQPDSGRVVLGASVKLTFLDQSRMTLQNDKTVYDNITEGASQVAFGRRMLEGRAYVSRFNFKGDEQQKLLADCSGGMRNRVLLARMLKEPANVIILDEPTNDLDLVTLRVLEEAIQEYTGSAVVVTHDRYFLNRVATHILAFEGAPYGESTVQFFSGDYESYHEWQQRERKQPNAASASKAGKYKRLFQQ